MYKQSLLKINNINYSNREEEIINNLLLKRGIKSPEDKERFFNASINDTYNPYLLKDMRIAVKRIIRAVKNNENILIYGDYDVDGITSSTLLINYFKNRMKKDLNYYLPDRIKDGYGLNIAAIKKFKAQNIDLMINVDCGIRANKEIEYANNKGIDVIVTDHHQVGQKIPEAVAVIDPMRNDDEYPFNGLAGVGVAFKLCQALDISLDNKIISDYLYHELDIVAMGTIADIVPLLDENRIIVKEGLKLLNKSNKQGLRILIEKTGLNNKKISSGQVGYIIAPHLNAAGRMIDAELGIRLLVSNDEIEIKKITNKLIKVNKERQNKEQIIYDEAVKWVEEKIDLDCYRTIILASKNWHQGIIGIVASRLVEKYNFPVILISIDDDGKGKASCRSISKLNIFEALQDNANYLINFGGHAQAAGFTINIKDIKDFRESFNKYVKEKLSDSDFVPVLNIDAILLSEEINKELYSKLEEFKPYGFANPRPKFQINDVELKKHYRIGKNKKHLKFITEKNLKGIAFGVDDFNINFNDSLNLVFNLNLNRWQNKEELQLNIVDINIRSDEKTYPLKYSGNNFKIFDKRDCSDHIYYLKNYTFNNKKIIVYINDSFEKSVLNVENMFYSDETDDIIKYQIGDKLILFIKDTDLLAIKDIDDLIFLSLPFSLLEMKRIIEFFDNVGNIHFIYKKDDYYLNKKILKIKFPTAKYLRKFYLELKNNKKEIFSKKDELINKSLQILKELKLIKYNKNEIKFIPGPEEKLDLTQSRTYSDTINNIDEFNKFCSLAFSESLLFLIRELELEKK